MLLSPPMASLAMHATRVLAGLYLVAMMFSMGLQLGGEPTADKQAKRRQRRLILRGLAFNLVLVPLVAALLVRAVDATSDVGIALVLLAVSPGGRFAPHLSRIGDGDAELSVEITLFLSKLVSLTAPLTARLILHTRHVEIHELRFIAQLLLLQFAPYLIGKWVRKHRSGWATRCARPVDVVALVCLVLVFPLVFLGHDLHGMTVLAGDRGWLLVLVFAPLTLMLGWLLGGPAARARRSLAISGGARDLALALLIASLAFSDRLVQLATLAIWIIFTAATYVFAKLTRASSSAPSGVEHAAAG